MLKFDASFLYGLRVVIIDFGPDDVFLEQNDRRSTGGDGWSERQAWKKVKRNEHERNDQKSWKAN